MDRVAIIGAGLSGLVAAHHLKDRAELVLFDKSRGVGGRISTRYASPWEFDHGAQFFTARTPAFQHFLAAYIDAGIIVPWQGRFVDIDAEAGTITPQKSTGHHPRYVADHRMNAWTKVLAKGFDVRLDTLITHLEKVSAGWIVHTAEGMADPTPFDWVIVAVPAVQAGPILPAAFVHKETLNAAVMASCHALMLGYDQEIKLEYDGAHVSGGLISWLARNNAKPGRPNASAFVVHTDADWSETHLEAEPASLAPRILDAFNAITGIEATPTHMSVHRWRYARTPHPAGQAALIDTAHRLIACGDWCIEGKVEGAFTSGQAAARAISGQRS